MSTEDPTLSELQRSGDLDRTRAWLEKDFDRARDAETAAINDFDRAVWLANAGAATVSIGFITAGGVLSPIHFYGACAFVTALMLLLLARFTAELNASRDRYRRQDASDRFFTKDLPISSLQIIRDTRYRILKWSALLLRYTAGILFIAGCVMTLAAFRPVASGDVTAAHNYALERPVITQWPRASGAVDYFAPSARGEAWAPAAQRRC